MFYVNIFSALTYHEIDKVQDAVYSSIWSFNVAVDLYIKEGSHEDASL